MKGVHTVQQFSVESNQNYYVLFLVKFYQSGFKTSQDHNYKDIMKLLVQKKKEQNLSP